jgi:hypothetical protein
VPWRFITFRPIVNYKPRQGPVIQPLYPDIIKKILKIKGLYSFSRTVLWREDFLALRFDFYNLKIENDTKLVAQDKNKKSFIVGNYL